MSPTDAESATRGENPRQLAAALADGDRNAVARALTTIERGGAAAGELIAALPARDAVTIGITGAPGSGKSTLTDGLVAELRARGADIGVIAVDPTSPFSGGAILGDRVRMQRHATDDAVFIRSMATRGALGGLALATPQAARVLRAAGYGTVIIETVGVGQVEVDVAAHADSTVVVVNPGWGDGVQAAKAGLMEIADVFAVNKGDRPGVEATVADLEAALDLSGTRPWRPPVVVTVATTGAGVAELASVLDRHRSHLDTSGEGRQRQRHRAERDLRRMVLEHLDGRVSGLCIGPEFAALVDAVVAGDVDAWSAAGSIADKVG